MLEIAVLAVVAGSALGSFAGVVATRGLRGSLGGRSRCDACGRTLSWFEVIPFVSFALLRGRCRTCHVTVGWSVLAWEIAGGLIALAIALPILLLT